MLLRILLDIKENMNISSVKCPAYLDKDYRIRARNNELNLDDKIQECRGYKMESKLKRI